MLSAVSRDSSGISLATSIISLSRTKGQVYSGPLEAISVANIACIHRGQLTLDNHMDSLQQPEMNNPSPPHSTPSARTEVLFLQGRTSCLPLHPLYPGPAASFRITSPLGATSAAHIQTSWFTRAGRLCVELVKPLTGLGCVPPSPLPRHILFLTGAQRPEVPTSASAPASRE